jgi:hypothetical protein
MTNWTYALSRGQKISIGNFSWKLVVKGLVEVPVYNELKHAREVN